MSQVSIKYVIMMSPPWEPNFAAVPMEIYETETRANSRMNSLSERSDYEGYRFEVVEVPWEPWVSDD